MAVRKQRKLRKPRTKYLKSGELKESYIQAEILTWLKSTGLLHWRSNSGVLFTHGRCINLGPIGCADITVVVPPVGTFCGLECKSARGRVSADQVTYAARLTAAGGHYYVVKTLEQAKNAIAQCIGETTWKSLLEQTQGPWPLRPQP